MPPKIGERWTGLKGKPESANMRFLLEQGRHRFPGPGYNTWHDRVLKEEHGHLRLIREKINDYFAFHDEADTDETLQGPMSPEGVGQQQPDGENNTNNSEQKTSADGHQSAKNTTTTATPRPPRPQSGSVLGSSILAKLAQKNSASNNAGEFRPGEKPVFDDNRPISSPRERPGRKPVEIDEDKFSTLSEANQRRLFNIWPQVGTGWNDRRVQQTLYEKGRDVEESPLRTLHHSPRNNRPGSASGGGTSSMFSAPPIRPASSSLNRNRNNIGNLPASSSSQYYNSLVADEKRKQDSKNSCSLLSLSPRAVSRGNYKNMKEEDCEEDYKSPAAAQLRAPSTSREIGIDAGRGQRINQTKMFQGNSYRQASSEVSRGAASILSSAATKRDDETESSLERINRTPNWNYNRRVMAPANPEPVLSRRAESMSRKYAAEFKTTASREEEATAHLIKKINDLEEELASQQRDRSTMQEHIHELKDILFQKYNVDSNNKNSSQNQREQQQQQQQLPSDQQNSNASLSLSSSSNNKYDQNNGEKKPSNNAKQARATNSSSGNGGRAAHVRFASSTTASPLVTNNKKK